MTAFVGLLALAAAAGAQGREKEKVPKLNLSLTVEQLTWRYTEAAPVRIRIENVSGGEAKEFDFNLAAMCWNHAIAPTYPNRGSLLTR